ncbi:MAG: MerR family transcriptional regulator [Burkholderiaceae bacterium]
MSTEDHATGVYRSGVAARLSGVPVDTLRIWERRYSVIGPKLSAGRQRLYSMPDIRRLAMIKQLVDMGHPIGTIASLSSDELLGMQAATRSLQVARPGRSVSGEPSDIKVALVGPVLAGEHFAKALSGGTLKPTGRCADPANAVVALKDVIADIAIIELPTIHDADLGLVAAIKAACGAASAIVLYRFAPSAMVRRMRMAGHTMARATSDAAELEAICLDVGRRPRLDAGDALGWLQSAQPRPPRFDESTLAELSGASRAIECECPRHLVDLVMNLGGFERYSAECASVSPSDALLHLDLQRAAALARSIMEQALERLAIAEGLALPPPAASP